MVGLSCLVQIHLTTVYWGATARMSVVKIIELIGESPNGWEAAMKEVVAEAQKTLRGITRIGAKEFDVRLREDKIEVYRVRAEVSFRLER